MNIPRGALLKLSVLLLSWIVLISLLYGDNVDSVGGGGGSYDLSGLVYGLLLFAVTIVWMLWIMISYFGSKNDDQKKLNFRLLVVGLLLLIAAWFITPDMF